VVDEIDRAQECEETNRELALAAVRKRIADSFAPRDPRVDTVCIDCNQPIQPERLAIVRSTSRCVECARMFEHRQRGMR
jgi:RNA polymerase-binding transcription factor DksA